MAKRTTYICSNCGEAAAGWAGRCSHCGEWNTLIEQQPVSTGSAASMGGSKLQTESIKQVASQPETRLATQITEIDSVLGGGFVPGSVNLLAGQPGIGKSTLLMQATHALSLRYKVLYISGEESGHQVARRAARLGADEEKLQLATSTSADDIAQTILSGDYELVIVDSIQTLQRSSVASAPGSVSQITNATQLLTAAAKQSNTAIVLVGHVTKEGSIAGPKVLEHVVDVVLQLEGERSGGFKVLRAVKNRFGSTNEAGIFEMVNEGLQPVVNPSAALLKERQVTDGSVVLATLEGTRPILVEVQALVNKTSYGYPKRAASGFDLNRLNLLVAMLERRTKLKLAEHDIYLNIVGGVRLQEPAADLAVCLAIGSAARGLQLKSNAVVFGEVGLSGEVRHVPYIDRRIDEAKKMGFDGAIGPHAKSTFMQSVKSVRDALNTHLEK